MAQWREPTGDAGSVSVPGSSPGEGNGNLLWYSCLGNPGESSLVGYGTWGCRRTGHDSVTEQQHSFFVFLLLGERFVQVQQHL